MRVQKLAALLIGLALMGVGIGICIFNLKLANVMVQAGLSKNVTTAETAILFHPMAVNSEIAHQAYLDTLYLSVPSAEAAIAQNPNNALAHERLGEDLAGRNSPRAIDEFRTTLKLQPGNERVEMELAYELAWSGHADQAKSIYSHMASSNDVWGRSAKRHLLHLDGQTQK